MLADLCGKPMIRHVWEAASLANFDDVIIATDDMRIKEACREFTNRIELTPPNLLSGSDRCAVAAGRLDEKPDIVFNIQCDEPMLEPGNLTRLLGQFAESDFHVGTMIRKIDNPNELFNPNNVKVIVGTDGRGLYFSRNAIPFIRDIKPIEWINYHQYWRHIGVYAYKYDVLAKFHELDQSATEIAEKLEQLRLLENGALFYCMETEMELIAIDTEDDLKEARRVMGCV